ncbi:hypothetical protein [Vibrio comitans]|uniref:Uncharacterized protein n=1 Tax=Vibrio comitans NBRC 102076 TaxID=1219078 RepID=A0A4Y3IP31_9VIBR|nr:hypothetical protein [Vibrio comitans]GEA60584.1 hypothetical protein VCO01S_17770 [Vibrio comitans NBRC 102076]
MPTLNKLTLTLLVETDFSQLNDAPLQLVPIEAPIYDIPSPYLLLALCAKSMTDVAMNRMHKYFDTSNMRIVVDNNGIVEHWQLIALCSNHVGHTGILLKLIGTERAQKRSAR